MSKRTPFYRQHAVTLCSVPGAAYGLFSRLAASDHRRRAAALKLEERRAFLARVRRFILVTTGI